MNDDSRISDSGIFIKDALGFSLIEFLLSSTILLVISIPLFGVLNEIQQTAVHQAEVQQVLDNTRIALETVKRFILQAGNDPHSAGFEAVSIVSPVEVRIRSDRTGSEAPGNPNKGDPDGDINDSGETIAIRYNNQRQRLEMIHGNGPAQIVADNISDFILEYFDSDGNITATGGNVRKVMVTISGAGQLKHSRTGKQFGIKLTDTIRIFSKKIY